MGCTTVKNDKEDNTLIPSGISGVLKLTITNAVLFHQASIFKMDPYFTIRLSNQIKTSKTVKNGGKHPFFNEQFSFYINSSKKIYGRNLQVTLMDRNKIGRDNFVGYGIVDLNPIIQLKKDKFEFRCMLNFNYEEAGFLNILAEFKQEKYETLHFRFNQGLLRRNTSTFGNMNCWVEVTIGEEILKTKKVKQTTRKAPSWSAQILTFRVMPSIQKCFIRVMDDNKEVGKLELQMEKLIGSEQQQFFAQQFVYEQEIYAGTLKFQTLKGAIPEFSTQIHRLTQENGSGKKSENYYSQQVITTKIAQSQ